MLKSSLERQTTNQGSGLLELNMREGFWLALVCLVAGAVMQFTLVKTAEKRNYRSQEWYYQILATVFAGIAALSIFLPFAHVRNLHDNQVMISLPSPHLENLPDTPGDEIQISLFSNVKRFITRDIEDDRGYICAAIIFLAMAVILCVLSRFYFPAKIAGLFLIGIAGWTLYDIVNILNEATKRNANTITGGNATTQDMAWLMVTQGSGLGVALPLMLFSAILAMYFCVLAASLQRRAKKD
jgi:hypothetical protein